jgi:cell division protein FtsB
VTPRRLVFLLFMLFYAGVLVAAGSYFLDAREEYERLKAVGAANRKRLEETEARLRRQETELNRLRTDPSYVEKKIRQKLGYARPDEYIFRFDDP